MLQHSHFLSIDSQFIAQAELDAYIEAQSQEIAPEIEIDSICDRDFGTLYRVWHGCQFLGTFYQARLLLVDDSIKSHRRTNPVQDSR
ncbi:MAG: hypothetical protein DSM106950_39805 [Stigonema ocellatum SAG 48.90 = DSM 106950]|nr:hypothetical protein [Stigonema ocellatum SAG 48.90 = DSM 106950]